MSDTKKFDLAYAPYFYYQDGQWFGYSNSVGGSPTRFGELV